jgi:germination protein M
MKTKKLWALLLALLLLTACGSGEEESQQTQYGLWFAVDAGGQRGGSSAIALQTRDWEREPTPRELLEALLAGPGDEEDLYAPFPSGVKLLSIQLDADTGTVQVDLSEQYGGLAGFDLTVADYCITLTLCQLPQVDTVQILVDGQTIPYRDRQELQAGDVLLSGIGEEPETSLAALYFPGQDGTGLVVEYRQVTRSGEQAAAVVLDQLLRGPSNEETSLPLPQDVRTLSLSVDGGVCQVDLSEEFLTNAPQNEEQAGLTLYALVDTLCALSGVDQVRLLVEGETVPVYGGVAADAPLSGNFDLVKVS